MSAVLWCLFDTHIRVSSISHTLPVRARLTPTPPTAFSHSLHCHAHFWRSRMRFYMETRMSSGCPGLFAHKRKRNASQLTYDQTSRACASGTERGTFAGFERTVRTAQKLKLFQSCSRPLRKTQKRTQRPVRHRFRVTAWRQGRVQSFELTVGSDAQADAARRARALALDRRRLVVLGVERPGQRVADVHDLIAVVEDGLRAADGDGKLRSKRQAVSRERNWT